MYKVLISFSDPVDGGVYYADRGDTYPRPGVSPTEERIAYLAGGENKFGRPVIEGLGGLSDDAPIEPESASEESAPPDDCAPEEIPVEPAPELPPEESPSPDIGVAMSEEASPEPELARKKKN